MAGGTAAVGLIADRSGAALSSWHLAPELVTLGAGMGMVVVPLMPFILSSVDPDDAGSASAVANAVQQIGGALGVALIGTVFFRLYADVWVMPMCPGAACLTRISR